MGFGTGGGAHATAGEDLAFFAKVSASVMLVSLPLLKLLGHIEFPADI